MLDKLQKLIDDGTITVGAKDGLYESETPILLGEEYLATVEGFRIDADPISLAERKYHVIVDFSFLNITDVGYFRDVSNCVLSDSKESYPPIKVTKTEDEEKFRRFDLVFSVPVTSRVFELTFNTGIDTMERIKFNVDINFLEDKVKQGTPGGCMFFIDDPVELIVTRDTIPL